MLLIAVAVFALVGCQQAQETVEEVQDTAEEMVEEVMDKPLLDPVTGAEVSEDSEWTAEFEGVTYYFSSEESMNEFLEKPAGFLEEKMDEAKEKVEDMAKELGTS